MTAVVGALRQAPATTGQPTVIVAHTVKGKGVSFVEADWTYHGRAIAPKDSTARWRRSGSERRGRQPSTEATTAGWARQPAMEADDAPP